MQIAISDRHPQSFCPSDLPVKNQGDSRRVRSRLGEHGYFYAHWGGVTGKQPCASGSAIFEPPTLVEMFVRCCRNRDMEAASFSPNERGRWPSSAYGQAETTLAAPFCSSSRTKKLSLVQGLLAWVSNTKLPRL